MDDARMSPGDSREGAADAVYTPERSAGGEGSQGRAGCMTPAAVPPAKQPPVVSARGLSVGYGRGKAAKQVVRDVALDVLPGEVLGLVGESGSGKSTFAKCIAGFLGFSTGSLELSPAAEAPARGPKRVQMVFQDPRSSFDPRRTLGQSVVEGLRNAGLSKSAALNRSGLLFERCGLARELLGRYPHQVSGGQCQRAAIARALAAEPALLIADEATSALDVTVQAQVIGLLRELNAESGMAVLFICHDLALVQDFCDRVAVMHDGRLVEVGPTEQVLAHPVDPYTASLIEAAL